MPDLLQLLLWPVLVRLIPLGIVGWAGWFQFKKQHLHTLKMSLFSELMGNRYNITGDAFSAALNRALVLFHDDPEVVRSVRDFAHASTNKKAENRDLLSIFRAICRNLKIHHETITNADFETAFNIRDANPIPVAITVAHIGDAPQAQVVVFGHRPANPIPFTIAILDPTAVQQLQQQLQQHLALAQATISK